MQPSKSKTARRLRIWKFLSLPKGKKSDQESDAVFHGHFQIWDIGRLSQLWVIRFEYKCSTLFDAFLKMRLLLFGLASAFLLLAWHAEGKTSSRKDDPIVQIPAEMSAFRKDGTPEIASELIFTKEAADDAKAKPRKGGKKSKAKLRSDAGQQRAILKSKGGKRKSYNSDEEDADSDAEIDWTKVMKSFELMQDRNDQGKSVENSEEKPQETSPKDTNGDNGRRMPAFPNLKDPVKIRRNMHKNAANQHFSDAKLLVPFVAMAALALHGGIWQ